MCLEDKTLWRPFTMQPTRKLSSAVDTILKDWSLSVTRLLKVAIHVWLSCLGPNGEHSWMHVEPDHTLGEFLTPIPNNRIYEHRLVISLLTNTSMTDQFRFNDSDLEFIDNECLLTKHSQPPVKMNVTLKLIYTGTGHKYEEMKVSSSWTTRDLKRHILSECLSDNTPKSIRQMSIRRI